MLNSATGRAPAAERRAAQDELLSLPPLPTTTIGSYPQTSKIRIARAALRKGEIDEAEYVNRMRAEIAEVVALQEKLDLDVLVHGEPERNDMVQYFAEQLDGFFATANGWVQSYGTRCVRPPILYGDVSRPKQMTVDWITYAQSLTDKPVKGMLTGPVTILAWSFVRDDQPLADSANQVALAIRDETVDLQAGRNRNHPGRRTGSARTTPTACRGSARLPGLVGRRLPVGYLGRRGFHRDPHAPVLLRVRSGDRRHRRPRRGRHVHRGGALTHGGPRRSQFGRVRPRRRPGCLRHSTRRGCRASTRLPNPCVRHSKPVPVERLWVNPDCGLKTRGSVEVEASLRNLVEAAKLVRAEL